MPNSPASRFGETERRVARLAYCGSYYVEIIEGHRIPRSWAAVAACLVGKRFYTVTIVPDRERDLEGAIFGAWELDTDPDKIHKIHQMICEEITSKRTISRRTISRAKEELFIRLAGPVAESIISGGKESLEDYSFSDYITVVEGAKALTMSDTSVNSMEIDDPTEFTWSLVDFMWKQTKSILWSRYKNWEAVQAVAQSLLERKTLSSRKVRQLVQEALGAGHIPKVNLV